MPIIELIPESRTENQIYDDIVVIRVRAKDFLKNRYFEDRITASFIGCTFRKTVSIRNEEEIDFNEIGISFSECIIPTIEFEKITTKNISIVFFNSIVGGRIFSPNILSVHLNNSMPQALFLKNQNYIDISFTEENIFPRIWLSLFKKIDVNFIDFIQSKRSFYIEDSRQIIVRGAKQIYGTKGFCLNLFEDKNRRLGYSLTEEEKKLFNINLSIRYYSENEKSDVKISNLYLSSLELLGGPTGNISIENTGVNDLYITDFIPKGDISFYNISPKNENTETKISIHKSNLDNVWFDNIDFNSYERLSLYRSKLAKTTFTSCNFPNEYSRFEKFMPIENVHYPENKTKNHHKDQYEIFLQLKKSLENGGNYFEAQKLQAVSHEALKKVKNISKSDLIILKISNCSNEHGLSIIRPFLWFLLVSVGFYILYLLSLNRIFNSNDFDVSLVGYYFSFIDITHRNDFLVDKENFNAFSLALDYVHKVVIGFLIYQFVAAFRKYGKK